MSRQLTSQSSLESLKKEAKRWLKALRSHDAEAQARLLRAYPHAPSDPVLRDIQHALALEHGLAGWQALTNHLENHVLHRYQEMADALLEAYRTGTPAAMERHWSYTWHRRSWEGMRSYVQVDLGRKSVPRGQEEDISLDDARFLVAREYGFANWQALAEYALALPSNPGDIAAKPVTLLSTREKGIGAPIARLREWDTVIGMMREKQISALNAEGQMTDAVLERLSRLEHITTLILEGSKQLTDAGLRSLARLPRLQCLDLSGTGVTDRGLEVLRHLPQIKEINLSRTAVTDEGMAHFAGCEQLERVELGGTSTGDGAMRALTGKPHLKHFQSGTNVTDAGIPFLHEFPVFRAWQGREPQMTLLSASVEPNSLSLRGSFTDRGIAGMGGLDGLFALNLDDPKLAITPAGLAPLASLANLGWLAVDAANDAMRYLAAMPKLRFLICQDTVADDDGFVALSRSQSLEYLWGRRCHNLRSRGFTALAAMPSLRALSVSCKNVDDEALAALPRFPALKQLMPMDVPDEGYRYIGQCKGLEALTLMYCRETTDRATEHIAGLPNLKQYFASYTQITDRTPELLSTIASLEEVELIGCAGLTNQGVAHLARLPRLQLLRANGMPQVTGEVAAAFPSGVRVEIEV